MKSSLLNFLKRPNTVFFILLAALIALIIFAGYRYWHRPLYVYPAVPIELLDLRSPDMLLTTHNLSDFPKDVAAAPILTGLVDEQSVFQYEEDEARLSLEGSLRRLAYEHDLELHDRFVATLLDAPAEVALWRSAKGRPEHFVARVERGVLAKLTETIARVALDDRYLKEAGTFKLGNDTVTFYVLEYGGGRTLGFAGLGSNWIFFSNPNLLFSNAKELREEAKPILDDLLHGRQPWKEILPTQSLAKHSLAINRQALTLEYGRFVSGLTGLRFDYPGKDGWQPSIRPAAVGREENRASRYDTGPIWRSLPMGAAFCAALPVDWQAVAEPVGSLLEGKEIQEKRADAQPSPTDQEVARVFDALDPIAAVCWYPDSRLSAPLFVARATRELPAQTDDLLARVTQKAWRTAATQTEDKDSKDMLFTATLPSRHGIDGSFRIALARHGNLIFFSPDRAQVDASLAVAAKRAPALGDEVGLRGEAWMMFDPPLFAKLVRAEIQEVLPANEESYFREVARTRLWPRLDTWEREQRAVVLQPGRIDDDGFVELAILPLKGPAS